MLNSLNKKSESGIPMQSGKNQTTKKLFGFIVPVAIGMMFSASATAQIVYKDIIPDLTINTNGGVYALDLNNDGITDFIITDSTAEISGNCPQGTPKTGTNIYIRITPVGANEVGNNPTFPGALLLNSKIDSSTFTWKVSANQILTRKIWGCWRYRGSLEWPPSGSSTWTSFYSGYWNGAVDKYIPLRLDLNSQKYYGWVRLDVASGAASFTVKDYAYNTIPDHLILAGKTILTGISENSFSSSINLFPNPATNHFTIDLGSSNKKVGVTITDITGKIIYTTTVIETQKIEVNTKDFIKGIYVVQIQTEDFIATKKLVVEK